MDTTTDTKRADILTSTHAKCSDANGAICEARYCDCDATATVRVVGFEEPMQLCRVHADQIRAAGLNSYADWLA